MIPYWKGPFFLAGIVSCIIPAVASCWLVDSLGWWAILLNVPLSFIFGATVGIASAFLDYRYFRSWLHQDEEVDP